MIADSEWLSVLDFNGNLYRINAVNLGVSGPYRLPNGNFPYGMVKDSAGDIWIFEQDNVTSVFDYTIFVPTREGFLSSVALTITDAGGSPAYESISSRVWVPATVGLNFYALAVTLPVVIPPSHLAQQLIGIPPVSLPKWPPKRLLA